jgi:hypothetical protein
METELEEENHAVTIGQDVEAGREEGRLDRRVRTGEATRPGFGYTRAFRCGHYDTGGPESGPASE